MKLQELFEDQLDLYDALGMCGDYFSIPGSQSGHLYRGIKNIPSSDFNITVVDGDEIEWQIFTTNKKRKPTASSRELHKLADDFFLEQFGWRARSQGVFATGSKSSAGQYGQVFVMVPIGPTRFVWSPKVEDMFAYYVDHYDESGRDPEAAFAFPKEMPNMSYKDNDLKAAIDSNHEIMFDCSKYLLIANQYRATVRNILGF